MYYNQHTEILKELLGKQYRNDDNYFKIFQNDTKASIK